MGAHRSSHPKSLGSLFLPRNLSGIGKKIYLDCFAKRWASLSPSRFRKLIHAPLPLIFAPCSYCARCLKSQAAEGRVTPAMIRRGQSSGQIIATSAPSRKMLRREMMM